MTTTLAGHVRVGTLEEVKGRGCTLVTGSGPTIAVFHHNGGVYAVDNRCPHMGFPLERGSVQDGILTCHWHHARFDLASGGTFNPFADDVRTFPVTVVDGEVWVNPLPPARDEVRHWSGRMRDGMEHNIRLIIAKAALGLQASGADYRVPLEIGADFGATYSASGWGAAMSMLTCTANMLPHLMEEGRPKALYQGLFQVSRECAGKPPRFSVDPLPTDETRPDLLKKWFRSLIDVRDDEGAERCLATAISLGLPADTIADMIFTAATDHLYLDAGHVLDFANKAFELLEHIGWEKSAPVLTSLVRGMARARRSQELNSWQHPIDLASLVWQAREELPGLYEQGQRSGRVWSEEASLARTLLGDDPVASLEGVKEALRSGATPQSLGSSVAYAAFLRMAHFHTSNEFRDWDTVHNTLTAAHALHQSLKRTPSLELLRGVFDIAISIYLDRFLNMPSQAIPGPSEAPGDGEELLGQLLEGMDVRQRVEETAQLVSRYLGGEGNPEQLLATLGQAMLREDSDFHSFQIIDAGFSQYNDRRGTEEGRHVLIAVARFLAAHAPTPRAVGQTYNMALRLHRGEEIYRDA